MPLARTSKKGLNGGGISTTPSNLKQIKAPLVGLVGVTIAVFASLRGSLLRGFIQYCFDRLLPVTSLIALSFSTLMMTLVGVPVIIVFLKRRMQCVTGKAQQQASGSRSETTAIIPCFLPNEKDIIEDTIDHVLNKLESPGTLKVIVVYNTPVDMPELEERLRDLQDRKDYKDGRTLEVIRVVTSKSKADNLNYILPRISSEYFVIYDADHNPDPDSLCQLYETLKSEDADVAQGSVYIRNAAESFMARMIDAEFFVTYFCIFPAMYLWTGYAVFGGSNALVRTEALGSNLFNDKMHTEDIDLSMRLLLEEKKIVCCASARSGELAPASFKALYKQRLRWAIGWDQVSLEYFRQLISHKSMTVCKKFCLFYWMHMRWIGQVMCVMVPILQLLWLWQIHMGTTWPYDQFLKVTSVVFCLYVILASCAVIEASCQSRNERLKQSLYVMCFACLQVLVMITQAVMEVVSLRKVLSGDTGGWIVTVRSSSNLQGLAEERRCRSCNDLQNLTQPDRKPFVASRLHKSADDLTLPLLDA